MREYHKSLLVRADFILGHSQQGDRRTYKRWRRILRDVLPRLLGCERRSARAEKVRLRSVENHPLFSAWVRIPIERRPGKKRIRKLRERLRSRLEKNLLLVEGRVVKLSVRRCQGKDLAAASTVVTPASAAELLVPQLPVEVPTSFPLLPVPVQAAPSFWEQIASPSPAA